MQPKRKTAAQGAAVEASPPPRAKRAKRSPPSPASSQQAEASSAGVLRVERVESDEQGVWGNLTDDLLLLVFSHLGDLRATGRAVRGSHYAHSSLVSAFPSKQDRGHCAPPLTADARVALSTAVLRHWHDSLCELGVLPSQTVLVASVAP